MKFFEPKKKLHFVMYIDVPNSEVKQTSKPPATELTVWVATSLF